MLLNESYGNFSFSCQCLIKKAPPGYKQIVESYWEKYKPYAPPNFQREFLTNEAKFDPLLWEMTLGVKLLDHGYKLISSPDDERPDLCIENGKIKVWIECYLPTRGKVNLPDSIPEFKWDGTAQSIDHDRNVLRVTQGLGHKKEQYNKWIKKGICSESEPFILAINGKNLDWRISDKTLPEILRALYGMGDLQVTFNSIDHNYHKVEFLKKLEVQKQSGNTVPTTIFLDANYHFISGILYSHDWIYRLSAGPTYCYVENVKSRISSSINFSGFAETYNYSEEEISL
ncbi:MAG: hypothetical protein M3O22_00515 [Pseudomonadota bacterium]|nr:hypothetical protein [Pseudomonadota bacterium]